MEREIRQRIEVTVRGRRRILDRSGTRSADQPRRAEHSREVRDGRWMARSQLLSARRGDLSRNSSIRFDASAFVSS